MIASCCGACNFPIVRARAFTVSSRLLQCWQVDTNKVPGGSFGGYAKAGAGDVTWRGTIKAARMRRRPEVWVPVPNVRQALQHTMRHRAKA